MVRVWSLRGHDCQAFYDETATSATHPKDNGENEMFATGSTDEVRTIACLHSSGSSGRQWAMLREYVGEHFDVLTPNLIGYGKDQFGQGTALTLRDEVDAVVAQIDAAGGKVHLVGHSFGGAVATCIALWYPERVASLTIYEPVLFSMLYADDSTSTEVQEFERVADSVISQLDSVYGRYQGARDFINYWSGGDVWTSMAGQQHARFASQMPKVAAEFRALSGAGISAADLAGLRVPVRLFCGSSTRASARRIVELYAGAATQVELRRLDGPGHMGPITHPFLVNPLIVDHIVENLPVEEAKVA
jgi:pimeloyl-ACP methyl ester carboxylesterase